MVHCEWGSNPLRVEGTWFDIWAILPELGYKELGGTRFVDRHFKEGEPRRLEDVKKKLVNMGSHKDRLNMAVLFFLASVVCAKRRLDTRLMMCSRCSREQWMILTTASPFHGRDSPMITC